MVSLLVAPPYQIWGNKSYLFKKICSRFLLGNIWTKQIFVKGFPNKLLFRTKLRTRHQQFPVSQQNKYLFHISQQNKFSGPRFPTNISTCPGFPNKHKYLLFADSLFRVLEQILQENKYLFCCFVVFLSNKNKCLFDIRFHSPTKQTFVRGAKALFGLFWTNKTSLFRVCWEMN